MITEPVNYLGWIKILQSLQAHFTRYIDLLRPSQDLRAIMRHDIDLFDVPL